MARMDPYKGCKAPPGTGNLDGLDVTEKKGMKQKTKSSTTITRPINKIKIARARFIRVPKGLYEELKLIADSQGCDVNHLVWPSFANIAIDHRDSIKES